MTAAIVDCGGANLASLIFALERLGAESNITDDAEVVRRADRIILPGVGSAPDAMTRLRDKNLLDVITGFQRPALGICLGMQLLYSHSEEGDVGCLGVIAGDVKRITARPGLPVPHMGWNRIRFKHHNRLLDGVDDGAYMYFVHGYAVEEDKATVAVTDYGGTIASIVEQENFFGTQFHPERSGAIGSRILDNFLRL